MENMVCTLSVSISGQRKFPPPLWNPKYTTVPKYYYKYGIARLRKFNYSTAE